MNSRLAIDTHHAMPFAFFACHPCSAAYNPLPSPDSPYYVVSSEGWKAQQHCNLSPSSGVRSLLKHSMYYYVVVLYVSTVFSTCARRSYDH